MIFRDFLLGFVRVHVLHRAAQGPIYGVALLDELRQRGHAVGPGTLYPLLHELERGGFLARETRIVEGRARKYYRLTAGGARALADTRPRIRELVGELLETRDPARRPEPRRLVAARQRAGELIRPAVLRKRLAANTGERAPIVIDVRARDEYALGHIPDARHIPVDELAAHLRELPRGRLRVTYCNMQHRGTSRSERAAALLRACGQRAQALDGGLPAWVAAGYPVDRGLPA